MGKATHHGETLAVDDIEFSWEYRQCERCGWVGTVTVSDFRYYVLPDQ
jgi:hypothetical protein